MGHFIDSPIFDGRLHAHLDCLDTPVWQSVLSGEIRNLIIKMGTTSATKSNHIGEGSTQLAPLRTSIR